MSQANTFKTPIPNLSSVAQTLCYIQKKLRKPQTVLSFRKKVFFNDRNWQQMTSWFWQINRRVCLSYAQITRNFSPYAVLTDLRLPWPNKGDKRHKTMAQFGEKITCCTTFAAQRSLIKGHSPIRNALHNRHTQFRNETSTSRRDGSPNSMNARSKDNGSFQRNTNTKIRTTLQTISFTITATCVSLSFEYTSIRMEYNPPTLK